jgi:hypothetical protein
VQQLPAALLPMASYKQFILYRLEPSTRQPGKTDKIPLDYRTLRKADPTSPLTWGAFDEIAPMLPVLGPQYGVGFTFSEFDPFWFLDIDGCLNGSGWNSTALELCGLLPGCAMEVSQSGKGLHVFGTGPVPSHGCRNIPLHIEFYSNKRFVALTGKNAIGDIRVNPPNLPVLVDRYFNPLAVTNALDVGWWSTEPVPQWRGPADDDNLIERACRSQSAGSVFGDARARFVDLWTADAVKLAAAWPPDRDGDPWNASQADAALAQHLAFWTGNDAERMERLMRKSMLLRGKWDDRDDYLPRTIRKACSMQSVFLEDAPAASPPIAAVNGASAHQPLAQQALPILDETYLAPDAQLKFFAGCVYVTDANKIMIPNGDLVDASRFNALYGGHTFVMDRSNQRTVRKAFEAFTENQVFRFPRASGTCFRPLEAPGAILYDASRSVVNTWAPLTPARAPGDVGRFLDLLRRILPDERDRKILLGYMAACVQHQGRKFQWAPLLQGAQGNGKTFLANCVKRAIGRHHVHTPSAEDLDNGFNAWLANNTFYVVEEIYIEEKKRHVLEVLKPMITSDEGIQITLKGVDASMRDICGNFLFLSNWRDALRLARGDRRIGAFFCAQQHPEDLIRDGLTENYFSDLIDWAKGENAFAGKTPGYASVAEFLWTMPIEDAFNPVLHRRAPRTTSTEAAIREGLGTAEQEVLEAIEQRHVGFKGGFVSSLRLNDFLRGINRTVPLSKQSDFMRALGYTLHPYLRDGRPNNIVMPDAGRPRLYVRVDATEILALDTPADIARAYSEAQLRE